MGDAAVLAACSAFEGASEVIRREYAQMEDGVELGERIIRGLRLSFDEPPVEDFEQILQKRFTKDEVRVVVFDPLEEQIAFYPLLLAATEAAPEGHALRKVQGLVLSSIFLLHKRHWSFLQEFVVRGGLDALANMLGSQNMYFRGQVIEIITCITDCDTYDWFTPPTTQISRILHVRMLEMADHAKFLDSLVANRRDSYPGGSARCLQILAFWLSWVRASYTQDKRLHLSPSILEHLEAWSQEATGGERNDEEERQLAATLLQDFGTDQYVGYQGPTPAMSAASSRVIEVNDAGLSKSTVTGILRPSFDMKSSIETVHACKSAEEVADIKPLPPPPHASMLEDRQTSAGYDLLKDKGNELFKDGNYNVALELYTRALDEVPENQEGGNDFVAALHYNRAAALWKIAQTVQSREAGRAGNQSLDAAVAYGEDDDDGFVVGSDAPGVFELLRCEQACREALSLSPGHFKATYRLAAVQLSLGNIKEAAETVNRALAYQQERERTDRVGNGTTAEFPIHALLTLRQRCSAAALARGGAVVSEVHDGASSSKTLAVLAALQRRREREEGRSTHAWRGGDDNSSSFSSSSSSFSSPSFAAVSSATHDDMTSSKCSPNKAVRKVSVSERRQAAARAVELGQRLKKAVCEFERGGAATATDAVKSIMVDMWHTEGITLKTALAAYSLEEGLLLLIVKTACAWASSNQEDGPKAAGRLLCELAECERFSSNLSMALFGNSSVKDELEAAILSIQSTDQVTDQDKRGLLQVFLGV